MFLPGISKENPSIPFIIEFGHLNTRAGFVGTEMPFFIRPT